MTNIMLKQQTDKTFIKKACNRTAPNVQAALITAASRMAITSGIVSESDTLDVLIDAYDLRDKKEILDMIGMGSQFVNAAIGYTVDYEDFGAAQAAYARDKEAYDTYYSLVSSKVQEKKSVLEEASKKI